MQGAVGQSIQYVFPTTISVYTFSMQTFTSVRQPLTSLTAVPKCHIILCSWFMNKCITSKDTYPTAKAHADLATLTKLYSILTLVSLNAGPRQKNGNI